MKFASSSSVPVQRGQDIRAWAMKIPTVAKLGRHRSCATISMDPSVQHCRCAGGRTDQCKQTVTLDTAWSSVCNSGLCNGNQVQDARSRCFSLAHSESSNCTCAYKRKNRMKARFVRGADTRLRIIRAAADLFHRQGVRATSPDEVIEASRTG